MDDFDRVFLNVEANVNEINSLIKDLKSVRERALKALREVLVGLKEMPRIDDFSSAEVQPSHPLSFDEIDDLCEHLVPKKALQKHRSDEGSKAGNKKAVGKKPFHGSQNLTSKSTESPRKNLLQSVSLMNLRVEEPAEIPRLLDQLQKAHDSLEALELHPITLPKTSRDSVRWVAEFRELLDHTETLKQHTREKMQGIESHDFLNDELKEYGLTIQSWAQAVDDFIFVQKNLGLPRVERELNLEFSKEVDMIESALLEVFDDL